MSFNALWWCWCLYTVGKRLRFQAHQLAPWSLVQQRALLLGCRFSSLQISSWDATQAACAGAQASIAQAFILLADGLNHPCHQPPLFQDRRPCNLLGRCPNQSSRTLAVHYSAFCILFPPFSPPLNIFAVRPPSSPDRGVIFGASLHCYRADKKGLRRSSGVRHLVGSGRIYRCVRLSTKRGPAKKSYCSSSRTFRLRTSKTGTHRIAPAARSLSKDSLLTR